MASRQARVFEWLLVAAVIGVILTVAANFYARMANDVQRLSFQLAAEHYKTAVSAVRAHYYVHRGSPELAEGVDLYRELPGFARVTEEAREGPVRVYLNEHGWPASTLGHAEANERPPSAEECRQLWHAFLVAAPEVSLEGDEPPLEADYRATVTRDGSCRYERIAAPWQGSYFDYSPATGTIAVNLVRKTENSAD